jgi:hypothetical protein
MGQLYKITNPNINIKVLNEMGILSIVVSCQNLANVKTEIIELSSWQIIVVVY